MTPGNGNADVIFIIIPIGIIIGMAVLGFIGLFFKPARDLFGRLLTRLGGGK